MSRARTPWIVFWSVRENSYARSPVTKVLQSSSGPYADLTLRSCTTTKKLYERVADDA